MGLPNYITLFRILLVPFFFSFLIYYNPAHSYFRLWALALFLVAIFSDALDGIIARGLNKKSELGTFLDPFADKLLLISGFLAIAFSAAFALKPPMWVVVVVVFRDLFIICGLVIIFLTTGHVVIRPNWLGKLTTFLQMCTIVSALSQWRFSNFIWLSTAALTIFSSLAYLIRGIKMLNGPRVKQPSGYIPIKS